MLLCLHRHAAAEARRAITAAHGAHAASAAAFGCEGGSRVLRDFYASQEKILRTDPLNPTAADDELAAAELATFDRIARAATAPH